MRIAVHAYPSCRNLFRGECGGEPKRTVLVGDSISEVGDLFTGIAGPHGGQNFITFGKLICHDPTLAEHEDRMIAARDYGLV